ncbi:MAG: hypothetical protein ACOY3I_00525 [Verrucomicrobiota bacterium]
MLSFIKQNTDALTLEKTRLEKIKKNLQRQTSELEARMQGHYTPPPPSPSLKKVARFAPDTEDLSWAGKKVHQTERLKVEKRMARNRVIVLSVIALLLLFWVGKILIA